MKQKRRLFGQFSLLILLLFPVVSCKKYSIKEINSFKGTFLGQWKLRNVVYPDGTVKSAADLGYTQIFYRKYNNHIDSMIIYRDGQRVLAKKIELEEVNMKKSRLVLKTTDGFLATSVMLWEPNVLGFLEMSEFVHSEAEVGLSPIYYYDVISSHDWIDY